MTLLFGLVALAVLLWMAQKYLKADPRKLAAVLKLSGGIALLGFAAFLARARPDRDRGAARGSPGSACSAGCRSGRPASARARRKVPARSRACARPFSKWSSITTPARCAA